MYITGDWPLYITGDYTLDFDTSVTEEEVEKSLREVVPAESHRKRIKRTGSQSDMASYSSDDQTLTFNSVIPKEPPPPLTPSTERRLSFEENSFTKFTVDMVKQYMREEEIRAQHQVRDSPFTTMVAQHQVRVGPFTTMGGSTSGNGGPFITMEAQQVREYPFITGGSTSGKGGCIYNWGLNLR